VAFKPSQGRILIITGLSGSGKSTALSALEDYGYFCIDNLPVQLLPKFIALRNQTGSEVVKLGLVMDMRAKEFVHHFNDVFTQIRSENYDLSIIFLEASDDTLVKRYSETRRRHPLAGDGSLPDGIRRERDLMIPVREASDDVIDTSQYNTHQLREIVIQHFALTEPGRGTSIELLSFGFKYGLPPEADILMDVRFLPNPYYLDELRELDGRDDRVVEYVMAGEDTREFIYKLRDLLFFLIPRYRREGRAYLVVAIGCTGGQHRSVTIVYKLAEQLKTRFDNISVRHRDIAGRHNRS
jgi:RNase adapter protein RapZ